MFNVVVQSLYHTWLFLHPTKVTSEHFSLQIDPIINKGRHMNFSSNPNMFSSIQLCVQHLHTSLWVVLYICIYLYPVKLCFVVLANWSFFCVQILWFFTWEKCELVFLSLNISICRSPLRLTILVSQDQARNYLVYAERKTGTSLARKRLTCVPLVRDWMVLSGGVVRFTFRQVVWFSDLRDVSSRQSRSTNYFYQEIDSRYSNYNNTRVIIPQQLGVRSIFPWPWSQ